MCNNNIALIFKLFSSLVIFSQLTNILVVSMKIVYPKIVPIRSKRSQSGSVIEKQGIELKISDDSTSDQGLSLHLWKNKHLITKGTLIEWHYKNGTKKTLNLHEPIFDEKKVEDCLLIGQIKGNNQSTAAIGKKEALKIDNYFSNQIIFFHHFFRYL